MDDVWTGNIIFISYIAIKLVTDVPNHPSTCIYLYLLTTNYFDFLITASSRHLEETGMKESSSILGVR
jgi:hypothetical protein